MMCFFLKMLCVWNEWITAFKLAVFIDNGDLYAENSSNFLIIQKQEHSKEVVYFQEITVFA